MHAEEAEVVARPQARHDQFLLGLGFSTTFSIS
jgi:hypothetical protein